VASARVTVALLEVNVLVDGVIAGVAIGVVVVSPPGPEELPPHAVKKAQRLRKRMTTRRRSSVVKPRELLIDTS